ncbi:MAG: DUF3467 domain-containing protein [Myxococcota bacterium]|nr:DUF3467 domain-containing protein [Myxococcota bacterium]
MSDAKDDPKAGTGASGPKIEWDDSQMDSSYANVCNAVGTREEVVLFFGISNPPNAPGADLSVKLSNRVILSPHAAKRLANLLGNVVTQYEQRFGPLESRPKVTN